MTSKAKAKTVEIVGIVDPFGAGGCKTGMERFWTLAFSFEPWRNPSGELEERSLRIEQKNLTEKSLTR